MRIAEYKQINTNVVKNTILVEDFDENGEVIGQHEEVITEVIPVMGMVYRDATPEEKAEQRRIQEEAEEYERNRPLTEIEILQKKLDALTEYMGLKVKQIDSHQFEVIKDIPVSSQAGTYLDPIPFVVGMNVEVGKWYSFYDENIWECIKAGNANYSSEWFDIIA